MTELVSSISSRKKWGSTSSAVSMAALAFAAMVAVKFLWIQSNVFDAMSTDDAMRLVEVRDLIGGQGWFDLMQYRLDPPGVLMHWSRVIDLPLAISIVLLKPLVGAHTAEVVTISLWPLMLFATAIALVVAIARQMSNGSVICQISAAVLVMLALPVLVHFRPGAIDHHNAQIDLLLALILFTVQGERSAVRAALAGVAVSLSLAIGVEMLPAVAAIGIAVVGLFIWDGAVVARQVAAFGVALAASSLALALALVPVPALTFAVCDAWGGPLLLLTVGGGLSLVFMVGIDRFHSALWLRMITGASSAVALVGAFAWLFAGCLTSPYAQLDPLVVSLWLDKVQETISLARMLRLDPGEVLAIYGFPFITLAIAAVALIRSERSDRFRWVVGIAALAALFAISLWEIRGAGGAAIVAAPMFAVGAVMIWPALATGRYLVLLTFVVSPLMLATLGPAVGPLIRPIIEPEKVHAASEAGRCHSLSDAAPLLALPKGRVMALVDLGPAILAETDHTIFAAPYHRNNDGNLAMLKLMLARPPVARQMLAALHVNYVVTCRTAPNLDIIDRSPDGFEAVLARADTPEFLERIDLGAASKIAAWRVKQ
jgi:hypothetical protein